MTPAGKARFCRAVIQGVQQMLSRKMPSIIEGGGSGSPALGDFGVLFPTLFEYLTVRVFDDGTARKASALTVFSDGPQMKAVLKDAEQGLCLWMAAPTFDALLALLEAALNDPATVWRLDRRDNDGSSKRVKPRG